MTQNGALPLYLQISELLIRDIASGRLIDGERLPPEREMAAQLGIAVGTLRQALKVLADKGLIATIQGSGNYIRAKTDSTSVYALLRIELLTGGGLPTARVLSVDRLPKDPTLPSFGKSPEGHRIRRLRYLSGVVAAVEEIWLDGAQTPQIAPADLSESLYLFYRQKLTCGSPVPKTASALAPCPTGPRPSFPMPSQAPFRASPVCHGRKTTPRSKPRSHGMTQTKWPMWPG